MENACNDKCLAFVRATIEILGDTWTPNVIGRIGWLSGDPLCTDITLVKRAALLAIIYAVERG